MRKSVLITGANGFIGSYLLKKLSRLKGYSVENLIRSKFPFDKPRRLSQLIKNKYAIIHLAGKAKGADRGLKIANFGSTKGLLHAIEFLDLDKRPKLLIFASTFAVYKEQDKKISEQTLTEPRNEYGKTKKEAENLLYKNSKKLGLKSVIFRISNVYGPGALPYKNSVIATFIERANKNYPLILTGDGRQVRDFVHIKDLVGVFVKTLNKNWKDRNPEVFNICSGVPTSLRELCQLLEKLLGREIRTEYRNTDYQDKGYWVGSFSKAKKILGWEPKVHIKTGLKELVS